MFRRRVKLLGAEARQVTSRGSIPSVHHDSRSIVTSDSDIAIHKYYHGPAVANSLMLQNYCQLASSTREGQQRVFFLETTPIDPRNVCHFWVRGWAGRTPILNIGGTCQAP